MQIKNNHAKNLHNSWIIGLIKWILLIGCSYFIYAKLADQSISSAGLTLPHGFSWLLGVQLILMIVNWYLEAYRWKISVSQYESITMTEAWQSVLSGLALNWILPSTSGDLIARISRQQDKVQTTAATLLNRGIMLTFTLILGLYGMSFLAQKYAWNGWFIFGLLFGLPLLKWSFKRSIDRFFRYFKELSKKTLTQIILISFLRYTVFVFQFYLLLDLFFLSWNLKF